MQIKKIKCPSCGVVLEVKNSKNEDIKQITCPKCKAVLQVKFGPQQVSTPQQEPLDAHTQLAGDSYAATQLVETPVNVKTPAKLLYGGVSYELEEGQNIVGRRGETSRATVQINTADRYMSRQHCSITVKTLPDGTKKAVLSNYQNKNLTTVDGQEIVTGDEIRLTDGNSITMGHTTVTFKLS